MSPSNLLRMAIRSSIRHQPNRLAARPSFRHFSKTSAFKYPRVDSQDKDSINTEATEYTKSGTDDGAARQEDAAFDPSTTDPQKEGEIAGQGNEKSGNPLDVSPANPEVSKPKGDSESAENSGGRKAQSGAGSPKKGQQMKD